MLVLFEKCMLVSSQNTPKAAQAVQQILNSLKAYLKIPKIKF